MQSAAQLSSAEFAGLARGLTPGVLRARVGALDHKSTATRVRVPGILAWRQDRKRPARYQN